MKGMVKKVKKFFIIILIMNKNMFKSIKEYHSEEIYKLQKNYKKDFGNNIWKSDELKISIKNKKLEGDVFVIENKVGGFCFFKKIDNYVEIYSIFVVPTHRKKGVARQFIKSCVEFCKQEKLNKIILDVNETNLHAINFYRKNNFLFCGKRKNYYRIMEKFYDAFTMQLIL